MFSALRKRTAAPAAVESEIGEIRNFQSATHNYLSRLNNVYDPLVVRSAPEFDKMLADLSGEHPLRVKTLILPAGVSLSDPRLRASRFRAGRTYVQELGAGFEVPDLPFVADVDGALVTGGPTPGVETRFQVLSALLVEDAERAAQ